MPKCGFFTVLQSIISYAQNQFNKLGNAVKGPILRCCGDRSCHIRSDCKNNFSSRGVTAAEQFKKKQTLPIIIKPTVSSCISSDSSCQQCGCTAGCHQSLCTVKILWLISESQTTITLSNRRSQRCYIFHIWKVFFIMMVSPRLVQPWVWFMKRLQYYVPHAVFNVNTTWPHLIRVCASFVNTHPMFGASPGWLNQEVCACVVWRVSPCNKQKVWKKKKAWCLFTVCVCVLSVCVCVCVAATINTFRLAQCGV